MAMPTVNDEILDPSLQPDPNPRYTIRDNKGNIIHDNIQIEMKTPVVQNGTALNKAFFTKLYNTIMADTSELVVDYTSTEDIHQVEITGLDLNADGGVYDVVVAGEELNSNSEIEMRINGISDDVYSVDGATATEIQTGIKGAHGGISKFTIIKQGTEIFVSGTCCSHVNYAYTIQSMNVVGGAVTADNVTSLQFFSDVDSYKIERGVNIKIYKRR